MKILRAELFVDIVWLAFCIGYIFEASHYPSGGRLVPIVVGSAGLVLGLAHFLGNFVPALRIYTHGVDDGDSGPVGEAVDYQPDSESEKLTQERSEPEGEKPRYFGGIAWAIALVAGMYLIGAVWIMPLFFITYFGIRGRRWGLGILAGVIMMLVTYGLFGQLIQLQLPAGVIWTYIFNM